MTEQRDVSILEFIGVIHRSRVTQATESPKCLLQHGRQPRGPHHWVLVWLAVGDTTENSSPKSLFITYTASEKSWLNPGK